MALMHIRVYGKPAPQGSKNRGAGGGLYESSKAVGPWREAIRADASKQREGRSFTSGPVAVILQFYLARPKGHYGTGRNAGQLKASAPDYPDGKPDRDKLERAALDGLTAAGVWRDDCQVVSGMTAKLWATDDQPPGCEVWITRPVPLARMTVIDRAAELRSQGVIK